MDKTDIDTIVARADRRAVYLNQVKHAKDTFRARSVLAWEGHIFELTQPFLSYVYVRFIEWASDKNHGEESPIIFLDKNDEPVLVEDMSEFVNQMDEVYNEALNEYHDTYSRLQLAQSTEELIEVA